MKEDYNRIATIMKNKYAHKKPDNLRKHIHEKRLAQKLK